jgi:hypothetical protein
MYNILEVRIEYKDKKLHRVTVLVEISQGDVRAIFLTTAPMAGYGILRPDEPVCNELLQRVAAIGRQTVDRDKIFPGFKRKYGPGN